MKAFIRCLFVLCIMLNAGIAQDLSFLNLTANKITSDTVFIGITNELICKQSLANVKFHSSNAKIIIEDGLIKIQPYIKGKLIIEYESDSLKGKLSLYATVVPPPTPVLKLELSSDLNSVLSSKNIFKLELILPGCSERLNRYEVVSFKAKVAGELVKIDGNRLPREVLIAATHDPSNNTIIIESIEARPGTSLRSFTLNRQYAFAVR